MKVDRQHVVPDRNGVWSVRKDGACRASRKFEKQSETLAYARAAAKKAGGEVFPHRPDGTVRDRDTYGDDSLPPRSS